MQPLVNTGAYRAGSTIGTDGMGSCGSSITAANLAP